MNQSIRLSRRLAELRGCSRAEAEQYIRNGWVRVDGVVVEAPQHRVEPGARVELDPWARLEPVEPATMVLHKPAGQDVEQAAALLRPGAHWVHDGSGVRLLQRHFQRLQPLLPLEAGASGLQVYSQDGRVQRRLIEDGALLEQEYVVEVAGRLAAGGLERLAHGLEYRGRALPPCKVSWQSETRLRFAIRAVEPGQLQHMCQAVGLELRALRRLRIGRIGLGKGPDGAMPAGAWRYLKVGERF